MARTPQVSVVIPTRDRGSFLPRAIAAALTQQDVDLEVIVVDDGSRDGTPQILDDLRDPRLRTVRHGASRGVAAARNSGIAEARGAWLAFLDDDDLWAPTKLRTQLAVATVAGASFAYGAAIDLDERGAVRLDAAPPPEQLLPLLLRQNVIPAGSSNVLVDSDVVRGLAGFDERLAHAADWDLWIRLARVATGAASPEILVGYSLHSDNMLLVEWREAARELNYVAEKHRALAARHGVAFDRSAFYRWLAGGHRRAGRHLPAAASYLRAAVVGRSPRDALRAGAALAGRPERLPTVSSAHPTDDEGRAGVPQPAWIRRYGYGERGSGRA